MTLEELGAKIARARAGNRGTVIIRTADAEALLERVRLAEAPVPPAPAFTEWATGGLVRADAEPRRWWWPF